jgi:superfamily II DNA or RNA helicase
MLYNGELMHKFNLTAIESPLPSMIQISGEESEKEKLKKKLTVYNSSVGYQLKGVKKQLEYWKTRKKHAQSLDLPYDQSYSKVEFFTEELARLNDLLHTEYWTETDGKLYIPAGLYYMIEHYDPVMVRGDIEPVIPEWARDYQAEAVPAVLKNKRGIIVMATGLGKSFVILCLAMSAVKKLKRVMVVVPTDYLVEQIYGTLSKHMDSVTAAGGNRKTALGKNVLVTTMQSALKFADQYDVIITDECHHLPSETLQTMFLHAEKCEYSYAVTATPFRTDGLDIGIHAFCGPIVYKKDVRWGIANGWLCEPSFHILKIPVRSGKITEDSLATSAYKHLVGSPSFIQNVATQLLKAHAAGRKTIVITKTLEVANKIKKACANTVKFNVADAKFKKPLEEFKDGKSNILVATYRLVSEGVDIPDCDCLFIVTQHSSPITTYQSVGRALRLSPGKKRPLIVDIVATGGYEQFDRAIAKRLSEYECITNDITIRSV